MIQTKGYAAQSSTFSFERKESGKKEILIGILYYGICHADIYQCKNEYDRTQYPFIPGHEIVGRREGNGRAVYEM